MIGRLWTRRCTPETAEAYETLLLTQIIPELDKAEGCLGAYVMRRHDGEEIEFAVLHLFESLAAVKAFAGDNYQVAAVPGEARALLASFDPVAQHFDVRAAPDRGTHGPSISSESLSPPRPEAGALGPAAHPGRVWAPAAGPWSTLVVN